jgi:hypothetical protein
MTRYWVDANVFIWGSRDPFPLDGVRVYWDWFDKKLDEGVIVSHKRVYDEVLRGNKKEKEQPIVAWVRARKSKGLYLGCTKESHARVGEICTYAFANYTYAKAKRFVDGADPFLIANASLEEGVVVTQENQAKEKRIPEVCRAFGVRYMNIYEMNRELKMKLTK